MYIGNRDLEGRKNLASHEVEKGRDPVEVAKEYNLTTEQVEERVELRATPKENFISSGSTGSNTAVAYYKEDGTPVYGVVGQTVTIPQGSTSPQEYERERRIAETTAKVQAQDQEVQTVSSSSPLRGGKVQGNNQEILGPFTPQGLTAYEYPYGHTQKASVTELKAEQSKKTIKVNPTSQKQFIVPSRPTGGQETRTDLNEDPVGSFLQAQESRAIGRRLESGEGLTYTETKRLPTPLMVAPNIWIDLKQVKQKAEELEIIGIRQNKPALKEIGGGASALISTIDTPGEIKDLVTTGLIATALGVGVSAVPLFGVPLVLVATTVGGAVEVKSYQYRLSKLSDPTARREAGAREVAHLTVAIGGFKTGGHVYKLGKKGLTAVRTGLMEETLTDIDQRLPKMSELETKIRLETGGIQTESGDIQTTFKLDPRIEKVDIGRLRAEAKILAQGKTGETPKYKITTISEGSQKIVNLERVNSQTNLGYSEDIRLQVVSEKTRAFTDLPKTKTTQSTLIKTKTGTYRLLPENPTVKFKPKPVDPYTGEMPTSGVEVGQIAETQLLNERINKFKLIAPEQAPPKIKLDSFGGKPLNPEVSDFSKITTSLPEPRIPGIISTGPTPNARVESRPGGAVIREAKTFQDKTRIPGQVRIYDTELKAIVTPIERSGSSLRTGQAQGSISDTDIVQDVGQDTGQGSMVDVIPDQIQGTTPEQITELTPDQGTTKTPVLDLTHSGGGGLELEFPPRSPPYTPSLRFGRSRVLAKMGKFKTLVRSKGKFRSIGVSTDPRTAILKGKKAVQNTASASFKVEGLEGQSSKYSGILGSSFRMSKREPDVYIQKRGFRIGTPGEKREITYKGILASKGKKKKKKKGVGSIFGGIK